MKQFMDQDFLLKSETAKALYHSHAAKMPIVDYHCHIDPKEIWENRQYATITEIWLGGDHYKWRAMRSCGVEEAYITGNAPDKEKFRKWAETVPQLIGNPLYHWTHLELQRYFGITEPLRGENADRIYEKCNEILAGPEMSVRGIIQQSGVKLLCTTDDPADDLIYHQRLAADSSFSVKVLPAFRPDKAMRADSPTFPSYVGKLESVVGYEISTVEDMEKALRDRIEYFAANGCLVSDHALDCCFCEPADRDTLNDIFRKAKAGLSVTVREQQAYHTALLLSVAREYTRLGWVMQLHFGCLRNNSSKMFETLGPDTGYDAINDAPNARGLTCLLDTLEKENALPKTILYSLNPSDNAMIGSVIGCFQTNGGVFGKIQQGSAWWFNDHKDGMEAQLRSLMALGALGTCNGMLTDSRSFLSYTRHEYFRRILCSLLGELVENGEYPADMEFLGKTVENISYKNAVRYFGFDLEV